jgi:hypothetical protein
MKYLEVVRLVLKATAEQLFVQSAVYLIPASIMTAICFYLALLTYTVDHLPGIFEVLLTVANLVLTANWVISICVAGYGLIMNVVVILSITYMLAMPLRKRLGLTNRELTIEYRGKHIATF